MLLIKLIPPILFKKKSYNKLKKINIMKLEQFKNHLKSLTEVTFLKPDGTKIPQHFHITEVGQINKQFIDCGGTVRNENVISMQLWESIDLWHRLEPNKLLSIIDISIEKLGIGNHEIEIEYQFEIENSLSQNTYNQTSWKTIGKYGIEFDNEVFKLTTTQTECLASDKCGIPSFGKVKEKVLSCCSPNSGCC